MTVRFTSLLAYAGKNDGEDWEYGLYLPGSPTTPATVFWCAGLETAPQSAFPPRKPKSR